MRVECTDNRIFQGRLVLASRFSAKPQLCISKTRAKIEELIKPKAYNVYIKQDFSGNKINIVTGYDYPFNSDIKNNIQTNIGITSKPSAYVDAVEQNMADYEAYMNQKNEENWLKAQRREDIKSICATIVSAPVMIALMVVDILFSNGADETLKFINKIAKKFASKKG